MAQLRVKRLNYLAVTRRVVWCRFEAASVPGLCQAPRGVRWSTARGLPPTIRSSCKWPPAATSTRKPAAANSHRVLIENRARYDGRPPGHSEETGARLRAYLASLAPGPGIGADEVYDRGRLLIERMATGSYSTTDPP